MIPETEVEKRGSHRFDPVRVTSTEVPFRPEEGLTSVTTGAGGAVTRIGAFALTQGVLSVFRMAVNT